MWSSTLEMQNDVSALLIGKVCAVFQVMLSKRPIVVISGEFANNTLLFKNVKRWLFW